MQKKIGRPRRIDVTTEKNLLRELCEGKSLVSICRDKSMPSVGTVFMTMQKDPGFTERYRNARQAGWLAMAETLDDIAENGSDTPRDKLRIETKKWILSKVLPNQFGDHVQHSLDPNTPLKVEVKFVQ